ncbi:Spy/CpxP family protein refolding chaperone [Marinobacterium rhizophilum]|uniref:Spy/CpxP family protein refolding chaperone n=1 Tax=Marinobacterium rhizophilum TaxID=420402 RepID=UPI0009FC6265|nr:Spy/CpxP family protein refolding chaperone [Marinobacterium rhizophilum]
MKAPRAKHAGLALALTLGLLGNASTVFAHGSGMMSGSMMGTGGKDHPDWAAQGHGMGYGMGYGSMMGPGMMGGCAPMHGYGGMFQMLELNDDQQQKVSQIHQELQKKRWDLMGKMHEESAKLRQLFFAEKRDAEAIGEQQQRVFDLSQQMTKDWIETQSQIEELLTPEQKDKLHEFGRQGMMGW